MGWVHRWVDIGGWVDGGWAGGQINRCVDRWVWGETSVRMNGWVVLYYIHNFGPIHLSYMTGNVNAIFGICSPKTAGLLC